MKNLRIILILFAFVSGCKKDPEIEIDITEHEWLLVRVDYDKFKEKFSRGKSFTLNFSELHRKRRYSFASIQFESGFGGEFEMPEYGKIDFHYFSPFNEIYTPGDNRTYDFVNVFRDACCFVIRGKRLFIYGYWGEMEFVRME